MYKYLFQALVGSTNSQRIEAVNDQRLFTMPPVEHGTLYLDGEGTASGYIATRGAELFLKGHFDSVVIAGGRIPDRDIKKHLVYPRMERDNIDRPRKGESEAEYMNRLFTALVGTTDTPIFLERNGTNTGQKLQNCHNHLSQQELVQLVTLSYSQYRLLGTARKVLGHDDAAPALTVDGVYPLGITKENWPNWFLSYGIVMDEADKSGPRFDGKIPSYQKFFDHVDITAEQQRAADANARLAHNLAP